MTECPDVPTEIVMLEMCGDAKINYSYLKRPSFGSAARCNRTGFVPGVAGRVLSPRGCPLRWYKKQILWIAAPYFDESLSAKTRFRDDIRQQRVEIVSNVRGRACGVRQPLGEI